MCVCVSLVVVVQGLTFFRILGEKWFEIHGIEGAFLTYGVFDHYFATVTFANVKKMDSLDI